MSVHSRLSFSISRFISVLGKEFIQMRRDRMTFAMMILIPLIELVLFGYAINTNPKHLPTLIEIGDQGPFSRSFVTAMRNSQYFSFIGIVKSRNEGLTALKEGKASFLVSIPAHFERDVIRGRKPSILISADATDPSATGNALASLNRLLETSLAPLTNGALSYLQPRQTAFSVIIHKHYNPGGITSYNIVPGLLAVILSLTMIMITSIAIVREIERGTMETLLVTPARPLEIMAGKILPYIIIGYIQTMLFLAMANILFRVPFTGSMSAFLLALNLYIVVNLAIGFFFSTIARNQMQAMQMSFFYMLPSILLSGFAFPFAGMPDWAQAVGSVLPTTHFIRIMRKVMLKEAGLADIGSDIWPLAAALLAAIILAVMRYRRTLD